MDENYQNLMEGYLHYSRFPRPEKHVLDNPGFNLTRNIQLTNENQLRVNVMKPLIVAKNIEYLYSNIELKTILNYIIVEILKVCPPNPSMFLAELFSKADIRDTLEKQGIQYKNELAAVDKSYDSSLDDVIDWKKVLEDLEAEEALKGWMGHEKTDKADGRSSDKLKISIKGKEVEDYKIERKKDESRGGEVENEEDYDEKEEIEEGEEEEGEEEEGEEMDMFNNTTNYLSNYYDEFNYFDFSSDSDTSTGREKEISCHDLLRFRKKFKKERFSEDSKRISSGKTGSFKIEEEEEYGIKGSSEEDETKGEGKREEGEDEEWRRVGEEEERRGENSKDSTETGMEIQETVGNMVDELSVEAKEQL